MIEKTERSETSSKGTKLEDDRDTSNTVLLYTHTYVYIHYKILGCCFEICCIMLRKHPFISAL